MSEPEVKGDDDAPLGKDSCHASTPRGNIFMLEQISLWKQVNLFRSSLVDTLLVFYLTNKIENVLSKKFFFTCMLRVRFVMYYSVAQLTARPRT